MHEATTNRQKRCRQKLPGHASVGLPACLPGSYSLRTFLSQPVTTIVRSDWLLLLTAMPVTWRPPAPLPLSHWEVVVARVLSSIPLLKFHTLIVPSSAPVRNTRPKNSRRSYS